jgi:MFS family permease
MKRSASKGLIFLTIFVDLVGFGIVIPILPAISAEFLAPGDAGKGAAILMTVYSLLQMMFSPLWGRLSERFGRRPILLLSLAGSTASYVIFAFAPSFTVLLLSRLLAGVCGANITAAQAYIADVTEEKDRTAGMGLVGMAFGLGFALGPVFGGGASHFWMAWFPEAMASTGPGLVATAICGFNLVGAWFLLPESLPPERRGKVHFHRFASTREALATLRRPSVGPLIVLFFLVTFAFSNLEVSFSLYAKVQLGFNEEDIYRVFVYIGVLMALVQGWLVRQAVRRVPEATLAIGGTAILTVGLAILPLREGGLYLLLPMAILAVGQGLCNPSVLSLISRQAGAGRGGTQGNVLGTSQAAGSLARIVGPAFGGIVFDQWGARWPFWAAAVVMAFAVGWAVFARARLVRHAPELTEVTTGGAA